jgi:hypothetical protein
MNTAANQIERADYIANADSWIGDRTADVQAALLRAIALALVELATEVREAAGRG